MTQMQWELAPIESICLGLYDGPHATPKPAEEGPIFLGIKNLTEDGHLDLSEIRHISEEDFPTWTRRVLPQPGDIVFTYEATLNRYAIIPENFRGCLGRRLALLRPNPRRVNTRYLLFYFLGDEWRRTITSNMILGSTVDRIPLISFPKFKVRLPPLPIQRKIAEILSAYDDLIENNRRRIAILEEMAQMLYQEWFVKFRFPGHEQVPLVESELGMIPQGWRVVKLGDIAYEVRRSVNPEAVDSETPYLGLEHLPRKSIAISEWGIAREVQSTKLLFKQGEILFGKIRPYLHKVGVAPMDGVCSSDTIVILPKLELFFALILCCVFSDNFISYASKTAQGTQMPRANWDVLAKYPLVLPPESIIFRFEKSIRDFVISIRNLIFRNRNLRRARDMLLPKLISGEIDVSSWVAWDAGAAGNEALAAMAAPVARRVLRESPPIEPIDASKLERRSLWE
ncbi:MAG: restriction endonuclease subunit S [Ktedonobacteraceae bacterium]|nr:restriction endonuclease subunit S [Ktedonobacteraceae bacterium]